MLLGRVVRSDFISQPKRVRSQAALHLTQKLLDTRNAVSILSEPYSVIGNLLLHSSLREKPASSGRQSMHTAIGRYEIVELLLRTMTGLSIGGYRLPRSTRIIVWIPVASLHFIREIQLVARPLEVGIFGSINMQVFVIFGEDLAVLSRGSLLPHASRHKIRPAEHLVQQHFEIGALCIVDRHPDRTVFRKQVAQQFQAWPHHGKPASVFQVVVVVFERGAGVVRGVNVDALHMAEVEGQQSLQRIQVVALNQHVVRIDVAD